MTPVAPEQTVHVVTPVLAERRRLVQLLSDQGWEVKAFGSGGEALEAVTPETRGCLVADVHLPDMDGIALVQQLAARGCGLPILVIDGRDAVHTAVRAVKAGATDFIARPYTSGQLLRAIDACFEKDRDAAALEADQLEMQRRLQSLSPRERETLELVAAGKSSKAIARTLGISPRTVESYRATAKVKMQAANTSDLVRMSLMATPQLRGAKAAAPSGDGRQGETPNPAKAS